MVVISKRQRYLYQIHNLHTFPDISIFSPFQVLVKYEVFDEYLTSEDSGFITRAQQSFRG